MARKRPPRGSWANTVCFCRVLWARGSPVSVGGGDGLEVRVYLPWIRVEFSTPFVFCLFPGIVKCSKTVGNYFKAVHSSRKRGRTSPFCTDQVRDTREGTVRYTRYDGVSFAVCCVGIKLDLPRHRGRHDVLSPPLYHGLLDRMKVSAVPRCSQTSCLNFDVRLQLQHGGQQRCWPSYQSQSMPVSVTSARPRPFVWQRPQRDVWHA